MVKVQFIVNGASAHMGAFSQGEVRLVNEEFAKFLVDNKFAERIESPKKAEPEAVKEPAKKRK